MPDPDDYEDHYIEDEEDDFEEYEEECGLLANGQCTMAGSEHCDWCCPNRNSEDFAGSKAWNEKHQLGEVLRDALAKNKP